MTFRPTQETVNGWLEVIGKAVGILLVLIGVGVYLMTYILTGEPRAEPLVFSTGALFFLGGAGAGLAQRLASKSEPPSKEQS